MNCTEDLINSVNKYNKKLEEISQKILNLKIDFNEDDIEINHLYELLSRLSVVNSIKSRRLIKHLLQNVINE